jgi:hypothetical protein
MHGTELDETIEDNLSLLREKKYKLRIFTIELFVRIDPEYGVEETLQGIRSIGGVTVVTAMDSSYRSAGNSSSYISHIKVKFHPKKDATNPIRYVRHKLLPEINGENIPGVKVTRLIGQPEQIQ